TLMNLGLVATTSGAVDTWKNEYKNYYIGSNKVIILPDNDNPGKEYSKKVANSLTSGGIAKQVKIVNLPDLKEKGDITDWINSGHTKEELFELINKTNPLAIKTNPLAKPEKQSGETKNILDYTLHTDTWNGEQFSIRHGKDIRYCNKLKTWFIWSSKKWKEDETQQIQALAKETVRSYYERVSEYEGNEQKNFIKHIISSEGMVKRKLMVEAAMSEPEIGILPEIFDQDKWLLNLKNGTLNLQTKEFQEHKRENYITKLIDINYNPEAKCDIWINFLNKIFDNNQETIRFVQKAAGYSLTGLTIEQCIFILHGNGSNGKSTFINIIKEILSDYAQQTPTETFLEKKNNNGATNDLARLRGARFVASVETEQGRNFAEALVKQISGEDTISARFLHKEFFDFKPECKIWIATNHKPKIKNTDHAIWRRIKLIPFQVTIRDEEKDLNLMHRLGESKEGILNWMIQGCYLWQQEKLGIAEEIRKATKSYREEMDVIGAFLDECCLIDIHCRSSAKELYSNYAEWANQNGEYVISQTLFGTRLSERGFEKEKSTSGVNRNKFVYLGIG
ncbi:MAG: phage/plasmid primase, P4 family, partial [Candidatus Eremiobacterota bacterium]